MQFTRLRLSGFKSFVDPTEVQIREGLTGVVGPNGCGKSNLLEAVRWVMGENRPSAMRGEGMEDVIFNGSARRPARAQAEVVLSLDNSARTAPAGFNDADTLEVGRKVTRDLGSAYRLNGREVRARDVQMLFADAATGAHSPGLVRQGQIADLINARPRARRRVLEDAAGIGGLYQRRHEAELKLAATESNLAKVADTLDQLAQQLASLQRQARQAARYRDLSGQLRRIEGLALWLRWAQAMAAQTEAEGRLAEALRKAGAEGRAAEAAETARIAVAERLPPLHDEAAIAGALVTRTELEAEALAAEITRAKAALADLDAQIARAAQDAAREAALAEDARASLARLAAEAETLAAASADEGESLARARAEAERSQSALQALDSDLTAATEAAAALAARIEAARAARTAAEADLARAESALAAALREAEAAGTARAAAQHEAAKAEQAQTTARSAAEAAETALTGAEAARTRAQSAEGEARAAASALRGEVQALSAEADGLAKLLARPDSGGQGVLAALGVAPGYERALGAALADDLRLSVAATGTGWRHLPPLQAPPAWPEGVEPLAPQVQAPVELARRLACVGLAEPDRAAALQPALAPGQRLVSRAGDLWRWDGVVVMAGGAANAAGLRLEQANRLAALREQLAAVQTRAQAAAAQHAEAAATLTRATEADRAARDARRAADRAAADAQAAAARARTAADRADLRCTAAETATARATADRAAAADRLAATAQAGGDPDDLATARARLADARNAVEAARREAGRARAAAQSLAAEAEARRRRAAEIARDREGWSERAARAAERLAEVGSREGALAAARASAAEVPAALAQRQAALAEARGAAQIRRAAAAAALAEGEAALRDAEAAERAADRAAGAAREARAAAEARLDAVRESAEQAASRILDECGQTPEDLRAACGPDADAPPPLAELETEIARVRRARDALGAVNLRADEDARVIAAESETLIADRADLEAAVAKLRGAIGSLNREGRERLLAAFDQVNGTFGQLFTHLFGGGEARLVLVESDDPLEAGLEILAQPPGKKLSSLGLLSGGEQTLTAMALIFAVFLTNPAPLCVLDEVDAPLDDANVARFCDLLDEMRRRTATRFLIITHNPITMARMDRLYGVTMVEQGVSQLVSVDLKRAEALVA